MSARVLIAGIGNIFFGDDGFATEVTGRLARSPAPPGLAIADFGTGTLHLAYALLEGPELAVIIDALPRGGAPGTLYLLEPEIDALAAGAPAGHELSLPAALALLETMGGTPPPVVIVGCEPASVAAGMGLSAAVAAAVAPAAEMALEVARRVLEHPAAKEHTA